MIAILYLRVMLGVSHDIDIQCRALSWQATPCLSHDLLTILSSILMPVYCLDVVLFFIQEHYKKSHYRNT